MPTASAHDPETNAATTAEDDIDDTQADNEASLSAETLKLTMPMECAGQRLDQALAQLFPDYSRSQLQQSIKQGRLLLNGKAARPRDKMLGGEQVEFYVQASAPQQLLAENIPLDVVFEDETMLIINKPVGLVVHPGAGNPNGTLQNALLHYAPEVAEVPRAGLIHRLDKDTSGLLVIAKTLAAHTFLTEQLQQREIHRHYDCIVMGRMVAGGTVDEPIARHPVDRLRMAVRSSGRHAVTHYRVATRYRAHSRLRVQLETGRTHQIRVHMAHIRHTIVGDQLYGKRLAIPPSATEELAKVLHGFRRQALHAARLEVPHPTAENPVIAEAPIPEDMQRLDDALAADSKLFAAQAKPKW